jgi:hypothetical protein
MPVASNVWNEVYNSQAAEGDENAVPLHVDIPYTSRRGSD